MTADAAAPDGDDEFGPELGYGDIRLLGSDAGYHEAEFLAVMTSGSSNVAIGTGALLRVPTGVTNIERSRVPGWGKPVASDPKVFLP